MKFLKDCQKSPKIPESWKLKFRLFFIQEDGDSQRLIKIAKKSPKIFKNYQIDFQSLMNPKLVEIPKNCQKIVKNRQLKYPSFCVLKIIEKVPNTKNWSQLPKQSPKFLKIATKIAQNCLKIAKIFRNCQIDFQSLMNPKLVEIPKNSQKSPKILKNCQLKSPSFCVLKITE